MTDQGSRGPKALLDDYAAIAARRGGGLVASAVRTGSLAYRDLLAHMASEGRLDLPGVLEEAARDQPDLVPRWVAALGRVIALQATRPEGRSTAVPLLEYAAAHLSGIQKRQVAKLLHEIYFEAGRFSEARGVLTANPELVSGDTRYLATDLANPYSDSPFANHEAWARGFSELFERHGLEPARVDDHAEPPFDGLHTDAPSRSEGGPLISVIMTTFEPVRGALLASVRSIIDQTWTDLEIIIVDDCSQARGTAELLDEASGLDDRIQVIKLPTNGGTYAARNAGIQLAAGEFVTGQDDDDWSHPRRLERQVAPLLEDHDLPATRSSHVPAKPDLTIQRVGYKALAPNASSTMFRRSMVQKLGGFIPTRKSSDTELLLRVERYTGRQAVTLPEPLAVVRIREDSLSRSDFRPGWRHPSRRAYRSAYQQWHEDSAPEDLRISGASPVPIPAPLDQRPHGRRSLDVLFIGDWVSYGGPQKSMIEEIEALRAAQLRVGVMHLEAARFMSPKDSNLCSAIQRRINSGDVAQVLEDEDAAVRLAILRYPPILQFPPPSPLGVEAGQLVVLANQAPSERDGTDIRYDPVTCADNAEKLFGVRALWVPQGPTVRATLGALPADQLASFDMPGILDARAWRTDRTSFRGLRAVVGRHSRDNPMKWPSTAAELRSAYPTDSSVDVRLMGGVKSALKVLGAGDHAPAAWLALPKDALPVRTFLNSLDFFVYFQHPQAYDAFGRSVLEALAAGCVAVLPHHMEPTFGDAAVYCDVSEARGVVAGFYADQARYRAQAELAMQRVAERFSHARYAEQVENLLAHR